MEMLNMFGNSITSSCPALIMMQTVLLLIFFVVMMIFIHNLGSDNPISAENGRINSFVRFIEFHIQENHSCRI